MAESNYSTIQQPYDNLLQRENTDAVAIAVSGGTTTNINNTNSENINKVSSVISNGETEKSIAGQQLDNIWVDTWIKSRNYKPKSQGFLLDGSVGYIEAMNLYISGSIVGGSIDIPNTTSTTSWHVDSNGNMWSGATTYNISTNPFAVSSAGIIRAISGTIGGCVLGATTIGSTTFVSGPLGSGWQISNTGTAELQDAIIRGIIRTSVFEKDTISAVNGLVLISKADVLSANMTALDASTFTISGQTTFVANEVVRIKDGTDDEWMLITDASAAPTYTVTRDLANTYSADTNPIWKKGTTVVSMGVGTGTKTGYVLLDSSSANSPYIDIYGRNSNTYTDTTLHGRFGWLKGIVDTDVGLNNTDVWGLYTDSGYFKGTIYGSTITGGTLQTASSGTRIIITGADNNIKFYSGAEASARVYIGTDSSTTSHIYIANPASSSKDGLVIYNADGIALDIHNNNSAADQALVIDHDGVKVGIQYDGSANLNGTAGQEAHLYFKKTGTGAGDLAYFRNEGTGGAIYIENNVGTVGSTIALEIEHYGTGSALKITDGDVDLNGQRLTNLLIKAGAPSTAELGTYGLGYDTTNDRLYFNNNGSVKYAQFA